MKKNKFDFCVIKVFLLIIFCLSYINNCFANPHISGDISVQLKKGLISASLCIDKLPENIPLKFLLNRGMNLKWIKKQSGEYLDPHESNQLYGFNFDTIQYNLQTLSKEPFIITTKATKISEKVCFEYTGAFPIYKEQNYFDDKGVVAVNNFSFRASEQSRWYPILFVDGTEINDYSYELNINCIECKTLVIGGSTPYSGTSKKFVSTAPARLMLYVGNFKFKKINDLFFIGDHFPKKRIELITKNTNTIFDLYSRWTGVSIDKRPQFLEFEAISKELSWAFVSGPVMAFTKYLLEKSFYSDSELKDPSIVFLKNIMHEIAHYYWGGSIVPTGIHQWFFLESTAEYFALKAIQEIFGQEIQNIFLKRALNDAGKIDEFTPLLKIKSADEINNLYRYKIGPLLLIALENRVGKVKMDEILKNLFNTKNIHNFEYKDFREAISKSGINENMINKYEKECLLKVIGNECDNKIFVK